jgi:prevent-host-death family protein
MMVISSIIRVVREGFEMPKAANWKLVNIAEAKAQLSRLVERVERGEVILIGRYGRVVAKLVPPEAPPKPKRVPGVWKGKIWIAPDFDEPNAEIARMVEEGSVEPVAR